MKQHGDKVKAKDIDKSAKGKLRLAFSIELSGKNRSWRLCNIFLMDQNFAFKTRIVERSGQCQLKLYNSLGWAFIWPRESFLETVWISRYLTRISIYSTRAWEKYGAKRISLKYYLWNYKHMIQISSEMLMM